MDSITRFAIISTTSTSGTTEKVNRTALADVREEPEGKGDAEQGKEQVDTIDDVGEYPKLQACHGGSGSRTGCLPSRSRLGKLTDLES